MDPPPQISKNAKNVGWSGKKGKLRKRVVKQEKCDFYAWGPKFGPPRGVPLDSGPVSTYVYMHVLLEQNENNLMLSF